MSLSYCKKFFIENKLFVKTKDYSHLLLDGGKVKIPQNLIYDFYKNYSLDIKNSNKNYICETKTNIFKLFLDLDFMYFNEEKCIDQDFIDTCITFINTITTNIFDIPKEDKSKYRLFVCETEDKQVVKNDKKMFKKGIHLVWNCVYVDKKISIAYRSLLLKYIKLQNEGFLNGSIEKDYFSQKVLNEKGIENDWDDIIDLSVFKANGLRMIKSHKMFPCNKSHLDENNKNQNQQEFCNNPKCIILYNGIRRIDEGRPYSVSQILSYYSVSIKSQFQYTPNELNEISIQYYGSGSESGNLKTTIISKKYQEYIKNYNHNHSNEKIQKEKQKNQNVKLLTQKLIGNETNLYSKISTLISQIFEDIPSFQNLSIISLFELTQETITIQVDCRYCMNKKGFHNSNHIYFVVYKHWMSQKCYCNCPDKTCKDYTSKKRKIPNEYVQLLLPDYYKLNIMPSGMNCFGYAETFESKLQIFNSGLTKK